MFTRVGLCFQIALAPWKIGMSLRAFLLNPNTKRKRSLISAYRAFTNDISYQVWAKNNLWNQKDPIKLKSYIAHEEIVALLAHLNRDLDISFLDSKYRFSLWCVANNLSCPHTLIYLNDNIDLKCNHGILPRSDLFIKYENGVCGIGAERWQKDASTDTWNRQGVSRDSDSLILYFESLAKNGGLIVQPVLVNHPSLAPYSNGNLVTLRVVTYRSFDAVPKVMVCCLRMPTGDSEVDNFAAGGLAASVSCDGVVGSAAIKSDPSQRISVHPDSGVKFAGTAIPMFREALEICLRAHAMFPRPHFVGWDVAFLVEGPTLLEANSIWCVDLIQMAHQAPMGDFGFIEEYMKCVISPNTFFNGY